MCVQVDSEAIVCQRGVLRAMTDTVYPRVNRAP